MNGRKPILSAMLATAWVTLASAGLPVPTSFTTDPEYLIDTWQTQNGLPENSATAMVQTPDGYLWVGTFGGLARFNGFDFQVVDPASTPGLPGQSVVNLLLDARGRLLMSTLRGLGVRETDGRWRTFGPDDGWFGDYARTMAARPNGDGLVTTFDGRIAEFNGETFRQLPVPGTAGLGCFGWADKQGAWWTAQTGFVGRWDGNEWVSMMSAPGGDGGAFAAAPASDGGLWVLLGDCLAKHRDGREVLRLPLPASAGNYWNLREDRHGDVWICTIQTGLFRVSPDGRVRQWTTENGLAADSLRFTFEDREGNVWVGTNGGGLQRFKKRRFHALLPGPKTSPPNITSIAASASGGVWIASYGAGLFKAENGRLVPANLPADPVPSLYLQSVLEDRSGRLWMGSLGDVRVLENGVVRLIPKEDSGGDNGLALFEDSRGRVWMYGGKSIAVSEGDAFRTFGPAQGLPVGGGRGFAEDDRKRIWVAHVEGVFVSDGNRFTPVLEASGQPLRGVSCLHASADGAVWMGTRHRGLLRWQNGRLNEIGPEAGLPTSAIDSIVDDGRGFLWMTSDLGVVRASLTGLHAAGDSPGTQVRCFLLDASDGLPGLEFSRARQPISARDTAGALWFPLLRGAARINPVDFFPDHTPPPVWIEELSYLPPAAPGTKDRSLTLTAPFPERQVLPPGSRRLEFRYAGLGYAAPEKIRYEMMLEGRDTGWQRMNNERTAAFYDLPPREYVFRVRAANGDGEWNQAGATVAFTVQPFYWQTGWFRLGLGAFLVGLGATGAWGAFRLRHERLSEKLELQQQRTELAHLSRVATVSQLSGSLAHEINQPLAIILSNAQAAQRLLDRDPPDLAEVREILRDIADEDRRAGTVIQRLRALLKRGETTLQLEPVNPLMEEVLALVHSDLIARGVQVARDFTPGLPPVMGDRVQLQQVMLNLINNACEAMDATPAHERHLLLSTAEVSGMIRISITDRGCGLPAGDPEHVFKPFFTTKEDGLGIGLAICRSIVQAHHGRLEAMHHDGSSTTFRVELPAAAGKT